MLVLPHSYLLSLLCIVFCHLVLFKVAFFLFSKALKIFPYLNSSSHTQTVCPVTIFLFLVCFSCPWKVSIISKESICFMEIFSFSREKKKKKRKKFTQIGNLFCKEAAKIFYLNTQTGDDFILTKENESFIEIWSSAFQKQQDNKHSDLG